MRLIKRLDVFILRNFLTLFAGTFCISLFVVMMQFLWKYIDDLVGKGLSFDVYVKFFFYAAETLVPMALPLAILLASLISFGNIGERLELLAIKAAGISLWRTMRSLVVLNILLSLASFHFQNKIAPEAWQKLYQMLYSIKTKSPELEIPEGAFYDGIQNINLYVKTKNKSTGMLYDVIIYNFQDGVSKAHIILADSGKLMTTDDKMHLLLHLYSGEQFENLQNAAALQTKNVPYRRETFVEKHFIIDFDTNFNMADEDMVSSGAMTKNMKQLTHDIDSMNAVCDSVSRMYSLDMKRNALNIPYLQDSLKKQTASTVNLDTLLQQMDSQQKQRVIMTATQKVGFQEMDASYKAPLMEDFNKNIRRHEIQYWEMITMSLACLLFFFIGASLGAIIRKGGLGFPVVVAVIIFIIYYTINTFGKKVCREGSIPVWFGMWMSTMIMAPLGVFFTIKSNNDSAVFNMDAYINLWRKLLGIRPKRHITRKEVIINDPNYAETALALEQLITLAQDYRRNLPRSSFFGYIRYIAKYLFSKQKDVQAEEVNQLTEYIVDVLSNSKDRHILNLLNGYPVMDTHSIRFYRRRKKDLREIIKYSKEIKKHIYENILSIQ